MWPRLEDLSKDDCRKTLRTLELETYGSMVSVLRAQGHFSPEKKKLLSEVASALCIPVERHKAEIRKAVNDDILNFIADKLVGPNSATDWAIEGRRLFPPFPKPPQCTAFAAVADEAADYISGERERFAFPSEAAQKAADFPFSSEPSSPEPSKTQSDSGLLVFPSGTAIQMKRESEDEEGERMKKRPPVTDISQPSLSPSSPPSKIMVSNQGQQIAMASRTMPFPPGSGPMKIALPCGARAPTTAIQTLSTNSKQVIIVSSSGTQNPPSILQKTLSVPMKASAMKPNIIYSPITSSNTSDSFKPRPKQAITSTPISKTRPNAIVVQQKVPMKGTPTPTKHAMPIHTKIVVQPKPISRVVQKPQHVVVQQKQGKQPVMTNVQVKTPQGFASVPVQLRASSKQQTMQLKSDAGGQMKMLSLAGGTKILPKPSQPLYVVTSSTSSTPLTMVTRTVPASCPPRVMTVPTGNQAIKWNQSQGSGKTMQTLHVMAPGRRQDNVVLFQKSPSGKMPQVIKDSSVKGQTKGQQKPMTALSASLQQLPVPHTQAGTNVILLDLSNTEKVSSPMLADILQGSVILTEDEGKPMTIDLDAEDVAIDRKKEAVNKPDTAPIATMSIEQAVEMLNRSDTPETRAILSQAGIQISDEIADSEEEEQILDSVQTADQMVKHTEPELTDIKEEVVAMKEESIEEAMDVANTSETVKTSTAQPASTPASLPSTVHSMYTRPRSLDIYTTALASANINLDSFMEEEDDPEPSSEVKEESKSGVATTIETGSANPDPLDMQLAKLTGEITH